MSPSKLNLAAELLSDVRPVKSSGHKEDEVYFKPPGLLYLGHLKLFFGLFFDGTYQSRVNTDLVVGKLLRCFFPA